MKSKPEYRHIFSSPRMFYRALHTISTQKYRLPVRRYVFDLFNIELDADVVRLLAESAVALRVPYPVDSESEAAATNGTSGRDASESESRSETSTSDSSDVDTDRGHAAVEDEDDSRTEPRVPSMPPPPLPPPPPIPPKAAAGRPKMRESLMPFRQRTVRPAVSSESEEEVSDGEAEVVTKKRARAPVMSLRPKSRIIGFN